MKGAYKITVPATVFPITLAEAKQHLKVDFTDEDTLIDIYIKGATEYVEEHTGRALLPQTIQHVMNCFPESTSKNPNAVLYLYRPPVRTLNNLDYVDFEGNNQNYNIIDDIVLDITSEPAQVARTGGNAWATTAQQPGAVKLTYISGYNDAANVPSPIRAAILLLIGELYERRENFVKSMPDAVGYLLAPYVIREF